MAAEPQADGAAEEANEGLATAVGQLQAFLDSQPQAEQRIESIVAKRLDGKIDAKTWGQIGTSLNSYLGPQLGQFVTWAIEPFEPGRLDQLEHHGSPAVVGLLRGISGLHGPELEKAFAMADRPDDWRTVTREVFYDQIAERHLLKLRVEKYNGESLMLEGSANSFLTLTSALLRSVRLVGTRDPFNEETIGLFWDEIEELRTLLTREASNIGR